MGRKNIFKSCGFSLTELLVTIAVLGVLVSGSLLLINPKQKIDRSYDARRKSDLNLIAKALEDYVNDNDCYPLPETMSLCGKDTKEEFQPYLKQIPCDPQTKKAYFYERPDGCSQFVVYASLEAEALDITYGKGNYVVTSPNYRLNPTQMPSAYGCFSGVCEKVLCPINDETGMPECPCSPTYGEGCCLSALDPDGTCNNFACAGGQNQCQ